MDLDKLKPIARADVAGRRVLVRADLNVPMRDGKVTDETRLARLVAGLRDLSARGAKVVVVSHFGRPKQGPEPALSLAPVAQAFSGLLGKPVRFATDCIGGPARGVVDALAPGDIAVLENLRFHKGEEANDAGFARQLAEFGDLYVNDAFSCTHRAHASSFRTS